MIKQSAITLAYRRIMYLYNSVDINYNSKNDPARNAYNECMRIINEEIIAEMERDDGN